MNPTIGIDIDSVLANCVHKIVYCVNNWFNVNLEDKDITSYELQDLLCLDDNEYVELFDRVFADIFNMPVIDGAYHGCNELKESGFNLMIVTSRRNKDNTFQWLKYNGFDDFDMKVHFLHYDPVLPKIEYLLDDSPKKIARCLPYITKKAFLLETPINKKYINFNKRYRVVKNWQDFTEKVIRAEFGNGH